MTENKWVWLIERNGFVLVWVSMWHPMEDATFSCLCSVFRTLVFVQESDSSGEDSASLERKLRDRALESLKKKRVHRSTHY